METAVTLNTLLATIAGIITAVVSSQVLRQHMGGISPIVGACVGTLSGIGLAQHGGAYMSALLIPYEALAIAIIVMLILKPFCSNKEKAKPKSFPPAPAKKKKRVSGDPWEDELSKGGKLAKQFGTNRK